MDLSTKVLTFQGVVVVVWGHSLQLCKHLLLVISLLSADELLHIVLPQFPPRTCSYICFVKVFSFLHVWLSTKFSMNHQTWMKSMNNFERWCSNGATWCGVNCKMLLLLSQVQVSLVFWSDVHELSAQQQSSCVQQRHVLQDVQDMKCDVTSSDSPNFFAL